MKLCLTLCFVLVFQAKNLWAQAGYQSQLGSTLSPAPNAYPIISVPYVAPTPAPRSSNAELYNAAANMRAAQAQEQRNDLLASDIKKKEIEACIMQTKELYAKLAPYPISFTNGWHVITVVDNTICTSRKVLVENNKIVRWLNSEGKDISVAASSQIKDGIAMVSLQMASGNKLSTCYFMDDIILNH